MSTCSRFGVQDNRLLILLVWLLIKQIYSLQKEKIKKQIHPYSTVSSKHILQRCRFSELRPTGCALVFSFELLELTCVSKMSATIDKSIAEEDLLILERKNEGSVVRREQKIEPHISHVLNGSRSTSV